MKKEVLMKTIGKNRKQKKKKQLRPSKKIRKRIYMKLRKSEKINTKIKSK